MASTDEIDVSAYPVVPKKNRPRHIVFRFLSEDEVEELIEKGYKPVQLMQLPTNSKMATQEYHRYMLQGVMDGTIQPSKEQTAVLTPALKILAEMSDSEGLSSTSEETLESILGWSASRHQLSETTMMPVEKVLEFVQKVRVFAQDGEN